MNQRKYLLKCLIKCKKNNAACREKYRREPQCLFKWQKLHKGIKYDARDVSIVTHHFKEVLPYLNLEFGVLLAVKIRLKDLSDAFERETKGDSL